MKKIRSVYSEIYQDKRWLTLSNILTLTRIILTPIIVLMILRHQWAGAFMLFVIASFSDVLDGYCARLLHEQTHLGAMLDPIADKFLLLACFGALAFLHSPSFSIPVWFFTLIFVRELIILCGGYILLRTRAHFRVQPSILGKLTTFFQLLFISWLFVCYFFGWAPARTYRALLVALAFFSVLSLLQYVRIGLHYAYGLIWEK